ncbi:hypothetical protein OpiT1DRAFT_01952 [Opitutaceae bacterium TAV1]|nr:hypothetical protein OpiT1DRAFT_01952 [Opitutaceae bacterium TAV1]
MLRNLPWKSLLGLAFAIVSGMTAGGALLGAVVFPLVGKLLLGMAEPGAGELALEGARMLAFFLGAVWAPGIAVVVCAIRARRMMRGEDPR